MKKKTEQKFVRKMETYLNNRFGSYLMLLVQLHIPIMPVIQEAETKMS